MFAFEVREDKGSTPADGCKWREAVVHAQQLNCAAIRKSTS
jgi:hypothetical protein